MGRMDEEQRVDRGEVVSSEERRVLRSLGGRVVVPHEVRIHLRANDRKQSDRIPLPEQLMHPELEDPSSSRTEIPGTLEEKN